MMFAATKTQCPICLNVVQPVNYALGLLKHIQGVHFNRCEDFMERIDLQAFVNFIGIWVVRRKQKKPAARDQQHTRQQSLRQKTDNVVFPDIVFSPRESICVPITVELDECRRNTALSLGKASVRVSGMKMCTRDVAHNLKLQSAYPRSRSSYRGAAVLHVTTTPQYLTLDQITQVATAWHLTSVFNGLIRLLRLAQSFAFDDRVPSYAR
ncbi:hypothetical protein FB567DRAFT_529246 [Paraphoma chrysanthemicola]|uniref:Uncharacterized protein n=1 Tax=Paraphoma chrysanthemicola TaxID=798071 RepID=A0A8K0VWY7_9PLEO|nr:hypothetical protein FB567DRAFT_529246 [Paraphoma chrysanthemicola]